MSGIVDALVSEAAASIDAATGGLLSAASDFISLIDDNYALITQRGRDIGGIVPDVTVEEVHNDVLTITEHPVESGAAISDHAYKRPAEVQMRIGFSDSSAGAAGYVQSVYDELLGLQAQREPFDVSTGKRLYSNMLVAGLTVTTDVKTEYVLSVTALLRQVIITNTSGAGSAATSAQQFPQTTGPTADNTGTTTPSPVPSPPGDLITI